MTVTVAGMDETMSQRTRTELISKLRRRYRNAGLEYKHKLLDQAQEMLGYHRKAADRGMRAAEVGAPTFPDGHQTGHQKVPNRLVSAVNDYG